MEPDRRVKIRDDVFFLKFFKTFSYTQHFPAHEKRNYPDKLNVELKKPFSYVSSANQTHKSIRTDLKVVQKQGFVDASAELKHWRG